MSFESPITLLFSVGQQFDVESHSVAADASDSSVHEPGAHSPPGVHSVGAAAATLAWYFVISKYVRKPMLNSNPNQNTTLLIFTFRFSLAVGSQAHPFDDPQFNLGSTYSE